MVETKSLNTFLLLHRLRISTWLPWARYVFCFGTNSKNCCDECFRGGL